MSLLNREVEVLTSKEVLDRILTITRMGNDAFRRIIVGHWSDVEKVVTFNSRFAESIFQVLEKPFDISGVSGLEGIARLLTGDTRFSMFEQFVEKRWGDFLAIMLSNKRADIIFRELINIFGDNNKTVIAFLLRNWNQFVKMFCAHKDVRHEEMYVGLVPNTISSVITIFASLSEGKGNSQDELIIRWIRRFIEPDNTDQIAANTIKDAEAKYINEALNLLKRLNDKFPTVASINPESFLIFLNDTPKLVKVWAGYGSQNELDLIMKTAESVFFKICTESHISNRGRPSFVHDSKYVLAHYVIPNIIKSFIALIEANPPKPTNALIKWSKTIEISDGGVLWKLDNILTGFKKLGESGLGNQMEWVLEKLNDALEEELGREDVSEGEKLQESSGVLFKAISYSMERKVDISKWAVLIGHFAEFEFDSIMDQTDRFVDIINSDLTRDFKIKFMKEFNEIYRNYKDEKWEYEKDAPYPKPTKSYIDFQKRQMEWMEEPDKKRGRKKAQELYQEYKMLDWEEKAA